MNHEIKLKIPIALLKILEKNKNLIKKNDLLYNLLET